MTASTQSKRTMRWISAVGVIAGAMLAIACGGDDPGTSTTATGGNGGSNATGGAGGSSGEGGSTGGSGGSGGSTTGGGDDGGATGGSAGSGGAGGASGGTGTGGSGATGGTGTGGSGATGGTGTGGSGGSGATGGTGGSGTGTGGSGATGGSGGSTGGNGGSAGTDGGTDVTPPRCKPTVAWGPLERVESIPNDHLGRFGGVSPDELTAVWTSGSGDIYVADRATIKDPFGTPVKINTTPLASDRAAIAATGNSIIAIRADRAAFVGFERPGRDMAWVTSPGIEFTQVKVVFEGNAVVSEPVLSGDKRSFFFMVTPPGRPATLEEAVWDPVQRSWGLPAKLPNVEFEQATGGKRRRPTGMSNDGRTLFFFDEATNLERAAWRDTPSSPFQTFKDIGAFVEAIPNLRCDTIYYQGQDSAGAGVFMGE